MITKQYLEGFFHELEDAEHLVADGCISKIKVLEDSLKSSSLEEVKAVTKDFAKGGKVEKVRASEIRQLAGYIISLAKQLDIGLGYHHSVSAARKALREAGIRWDGKPVQTEQQREQANLTRIIADAAAQALQEGRTVEEAVRFAEEQQAALEILRAAKRAEAIWENLKKKESRDVLANLANLILSEQTQDNSINQPVSLAA